MTILVDSQEVRESKSLSGMLVDMPDKDFQRMIDEANMTALLNARMSLHMVYNHTVQVKDALIEHVEEKGDQEVAVQTIKELHTVLLKVEGRFAIVKKTIAEREAIVESNYGALKVGS